MITFEHGLDTRTRRQSKPTVARIRVTGTQYRYCVIGTDYGHIHTTAGDVRTWGSYGGAHKAAKRYVGI
jgi:hypothetical protein